MGIYDRKATDDQLVAAIKEGLTQSQVLERFNMQLSGSGSQRIRRLCKEHGLIINRSATGRPMLEDEQASKRINEYLKPHGRRSIRCDNGTVIVFSDAHFFPGIRSTAFRALLTACKELRPSAVINNGDSLDGASISKWPRIGWDAKPSVLQELEASTERLVEIEQAAGTRNLYWNLGNHDSRFETFLAGKVPEYQGVSGFHLKDHFSAWLPSWSVWINEEVVVKHRMKGGINATRNNALNAGKSVVTGHLHSLKVTPLSDYNGTRWGVDTGTLAQAYGPQFTDYTEDGVTDWRSGFVVLTFWQGRMIDPEILRVMDEDQGLVTFRGQVVAV